MKPDLEIEATSQSPPALPNANVPPSAFEGLSRLWARLGQHKVLQWTVAYCATGLALAQGQEILANAFGLPNAVQRVFLGVLIVGLPIVITLAWYHGHRTLKQFTAGEATIVSLLMLIGAALLFGLLDYRPEKKEPATIDGGASRDSASDIVGGKPAVARRLRVAIMPFENLSPDPSHAFFADGLHDEILVTLRNRARDLEVVPRTTMMTYRAAPRPIQVVAAETRASHVIEGVVRREGNEVRVTVTLIDAATDSAIWSPPPFDRELAESLTLQTEIATQVTQQLSLEMLGQPSPGPPTKDPEAYDLFLKARVAMQSLNPATTAAEVLAIEESLDAAIARDPMFASAYIERGNIKFAWLSRMDSARNAEQIAAARRDLDTARRLDGDSANVLALAARIAFAEEGDDSERVNMAVDAALAANPNDTDLAMAKYRLLVRAGRLDEASERLQAQVLLDPANQTLYGNYFALQETMDRPAEALRAIDQLRRFDLPIVPVERARLIFNYTGRLDGFTAAVDNPRVQQFDAELRVGLAFETLRLRGLHDELREVLRAAGLSEIQPMGHGYSRLMPIDAARGRAALLAGDIASMRAAGRSLLALDAVAQPEAEPYNTALRALAFTLLTQDANAVREARAALARFAERPDIDGYHDMLLHSAIALAWSSAEDEAVSLLETHSTREHWALPPATVTREPLLTTRLNGHAGYAALVERLEAEMARSTLR